MPGYRVREIEHAIGSHAYRLRVLVDTQQFADPDGHSARIGISSAQWSLFGQVWPAGRLLAQAMHRFDIEGKRIMELGCGIGLASLVLQRRGADVVATDSHPLAEVFLAYNAALNKLSALHYRQLRWNQPLPALGRFDVIIASDVLYERDHAELIAGVVERHALPIAEVLVTDPGRGNSGPFTRAMATQGYEVVEIRSRFDEKDSEPFRGRLLSYRRGAPMANAPRTLQ